MFKIDSSKLKKVVRIISKNTMVKMSDKEIEDFILADWPEGDEHQDWLNESDAEEIASWVGDCNHGRGI
jgi:hypothetical protein